MQIIQLEEMLANDTRQFKIGFNDTIQEKHVYLAITGSDHDIMATEVRFDIGS